MSIGRISQLRAELFEKKTVFALRTCGLFL